MQNFTPIGQVPKDYDPLVISEVKNPFKKVFKHPFDGKIIEIGVGETLEAPENVARHMAEHIAKMKIRMDHEKHLEGIMKKYGEDSKTYQKAKSGAIPLYDSKIKEEVKKVMVNRSTTKKTDIGIRAMTQTEKMQEGKRIKKLATEMATKMVEDEKRVKENKAKGEKLAPAPE